MCDFGPVVGVAIDDDRARLRILVGRDMATCGVSPTGVMVIVEVAAELWAATVVPSSDDSTSKLPAVLLFASGVNFTPAWACA